MDGTFPTENWGCCNWDEKEMGKLLDLSCIHTCDLVRELENRDGVNVAELSPYESREFMFNGPAVIIEVID
ncbi:MAG: BC1881 family protein [Clostridia bacterium]|nr:BC1881 family protein [Clostridia bacterium]